MAAPTEPPSHRLSELGILLPAVVPPVAAYVAGRPVRVRWCSPPDSCRWSTASCARPARSGDAVTPELAYECARACALNALAAIDALVGIDSVRGW